MDKQIERQTDIKSEIVQLANKIDRCLHLLKHGIGHSDLAFLTKKMPKKVDIQFLRPESGTSALEETAPPGELEFFSR